MSKNVIKRALLSVSDKTGIVDLAKTLENANVEILSTGGTYSLLSKNGITVKEVSSETGFPEIMGGRVKTLHPKIHGAILGRRSTDDVVASEHGITYIDLVVVNLYPFRETIANPENLYEDAIENIDIGGPTMIRAAAKNHNDVTVVVAPEDYQALAIEISQGAISAETRKTLAAKAFAHTADYDGAIANYLGSQDSEDSYPTTFNRQFHKKQALRYGENPHQSAAFYVEENTPKASISASVQLQGKALSFNNIADSDAALECVKSFKKPACVIVKHANPCGVATDNNILDAYNKAFKTDPTSAFGGIIAFNRPLDEDTARCIIERQFVEVIIAPEVSETAKTILATKKNVRVLSCGPLDQATQGLDFKRVNGGLLIQDSDQHIITEQDLKVVSKVQPTEKQIEDLLFAWNVANYVKSNAIVYARDRMTIGIGAGQMSRVYSAKIANIKAEDEGLVVTGSVMASDAFFPFRDGIDAAAQAGIKAIIQPGGSMRDEEVIAAADEHGIAMVFTSIRHFRH